MCTHESTTLPDWDHQRKRSCLALASCSEPLPLSPHQLFMDSGSRGNAALQDLFFRSPTPPGSKDTIGNIYSGQNLSTDQVSSLFPRGSDPLYENESGRAKSPHMPGSLHDDPAVTIAASNADRQSTLLSLLSTNPNPRPQQVGTPPAHVHHSGDSSPTGHNEAQGKLLLEQLMAGLVSFPLSSAFQMLYRPRACKKASLFRQFWTQSFDDFLL